MVDDKGFLHVEAGSPEGGQFTSKGGSAGGGAASSKSERWEEVEPAPWSEEDERILQEEKKTKKQRRKKQQLPEPYDVSKLASSAEEAIALSPYKTVGLRNGTVMGNWRTKEQAEAYAKQLMDEGSLPMKAEFRGAVIRNDEDGTETSIAEHANGFSVSMKDIDSGSMLPTHSIFPSNQYDKALAYAKKIANQPNDAKQPPKFGESPGTAKGKKPDQGTLFSDDKAKQYMIDAPVIDLPEKPSQPNDYTCGAYCAFAVGRLFGVGPETPREWVKKLGTNRAHATSIDRICDYLQELGLKTECKDDMSLPDLADAVAKGCPVICPIQGYGTETNDQPYGHVVVVIHVDGNRVIVYDPSVDNEIDNIDDTNKAQNENIIDASKWVDVWWDVQDGKDYKRFGIIVSDGKMYEDASVRTRIKAAAAAVKQDATELQREAGNHKMGHVSVQGLAITIEYPKGSTRSGVSPDGKQWSQVMNCHYGRIKRTVDKDGEQVDVFLGPYPESEIVFVIDQVRPSGRFDEHKALIGFNCEYKACEAYLSHYPPNWKGIGGIKAMRMDDFKEWVKDGETTKRICEQTFHYMVDDKGFLHVEAGSPEGGRFVVTNRGRSYFVRWAGTPTKEEVLKAWEEDKATGNKKNFLPYDSTTGQTAKTEQKKLFADGAVNHYMVNPHGFLGMEGDISDWIVQQQTAAEAKALQNQDPKEAGKRGKRLADEIKRRFQIKRMLIDFDNQYEDTEGMRHYAQVHAPKGGVTIAGKRFRGGEFIMGEDLAKMGPNEKADLLSKQHIRAGDEGDVLAHFDQSQPGQEDWKRASVRGDKNYVAKMDEYFSGLIESIGEEFYDDLDNDIGQARQAAEDRLINVAGDYHNAMLHHFVARYPTIQDNEAVKEAVAEFEENLNEAYSDAVNEVYGIADEFEENGEADFETLNYDLQQMGNKMQDARATLEQALDDEIDRLNDEDDALQNEVIDNHFDDLRQDVQINLESLTDATQEEIDLIWDSMIRDYNRMIDEYDDNNPYRITIDEDGDLMVTNKEDLPDEHKPREEKGKTEQGELYEDVLASMHLYEDRFITIGGKQEGDKKHAGGQVVKISDKGKLLSGPPQMRGTNIADAKQNFDKLHKEEKASPEQKEEPKAEEKGQPDIVSPEGRMSRADAMREKMRSKQGPKPEAPPPEQTQAVSSESLVNEKGELQKAETPAQEPGAPAEKAEKPAAALGKEQPPMAKDFTPSYVKTDFEKKVMLEDVAKEHAEYVDASNRRRAVLNEVKQGKRPVDDAVRTWKYMTPAWNNLKSAFQSAMKKRQQSGDVPKGEEAPAAEQKPSGTPTTEAPKVIGEASKKKPFGRPAKKWKTKTEKHARMKYDPKKDPKGSSLYKIIDKDFGGISLKSMIAHGYDVKELMKKGSSLVGLFRKNGGADITEVAEGLHNEGHIQVPGGTGSKGGDPSQYLLDQLHARAKSLQQNSENEYEKSYKEFLQREADARANTDIQGSDIAEATRSGEDEGILAEAKSADGGDLGGMANEEQDAGRGDAWEGEPGESTSGASVAPSDDVPFSDEERKKMYEDYCRQFESIFDGASALCNK